MDFPAIEIVVPSVNRKPTSKLLKLHSPNGSFAVVRGKTGKMNYFTITDIDAVMSIASPSQN